SISSSGLFKSSSYKYSFVVLPLGWFPPAPFNNISQGPSFSKTSSRALTKLCLSSTSASIPIAIPPFFSTALTLSLSFSLLLPSKATLAPQVARASTQTLPNTPVPPVITATLSFKSILNGNFMIIHPLHMFCLMSPIYQQYTWHLMLYHIIHIQVYQFL